MKAVILALLLVPGASLASAQTPNGIPPANEAVCDGLMFATPGLYGLCVAFCEAQDCEPDFSLTDPFENCLPASQKLLDLYDKKKQSGDPDMPCIQKPCPCWTQAEIDGLRYPDPSDTILCLKDDDRPPPKGHTNRDIWVIQPPASSVTGYFTGLVTYEDAAGSGPRCLLSDRCVDGNCLQITRGAFISPAEFATCEAQLSQAAIDRGLGCFLN